MWTKPISSIPRLLEFIAFYVGRRKTAYGYSEAELGDAMLPSPLRDLYAFAGKWPRRSGRLLACQNRLLPLEDVRISNGRFAFIEENQWCWCLGTDVRGRNPAVYYSDDVETVTWQETGIGLIECVRTFVMVELMFASDIWISDAALPATTSLLTACRDSSSTWRVLGRNLRAYDPNHHWSFFLMNDTSIVAHEQYDGGDFVYGSANNRHGIRTLKQLASQFDLEIFPRVH
ncbi:hypothetical protein [Crateriforma conspicua]|uniref:Uncharacterized protein n=1 Tax=Crateriforma conspicua TaxID=2527996 RepID=A0A5C5XPX6_9PLAN|nr:hypothetical protein [Crateriforma conspicua]TWT64934.1 hypothetical protein Pan14r_54360 [Crateriforma conspicua]